MLELDTPARPRAGAPASGPRRALVLGHGAGDGVGAPDLVLATEVANGLGIAVAVGGCDRGFAWKPKPCRETSAAQAHTVRAWRTGR